MFQMTGTRFAIYQIPEDSRERPINSWGQKKEGSRELRSMPLTTNVSYSAQMLPSDDLPTLYSMFQENVPRILSLILLRSVMW